MHGLGCKVGEGNDLMEKSMMRRASTARLLAAVVIVYALVFGDPSPASATPPPYEGSLTFPTIYGSAEPEDFSWEVTLDEEQELRQINEREVGVFFASGHRAFSIQATRAHDAVG